MEDFLEKHSLALREHDFLYPLIKKWKTGEIVPSLAAGVGGTIVSGGDPVAGIAVAAVTRLVQGLGQLGLDRVRAIAHPLYEQFDFRPYDFVLLLGYKKNYKKELVTRRFDPIVKVAEAKPECSENDKALADLLTKAMGKLEGQKTLYDTEHLVREQSEFIERMLQKDILSVGGPIPIDPIYEAMIERDHLPCNYKLRDFKSEDIYSPELTGMPDKILPKYPVIIPRTEEPLYPKWNELNWGIITCVDKRLIFEERKWGKVKGLFFNVSGCQWFGTRGSGLQLLEKDGVRTLADYVKQEIGTSKNFQVIMKVTINPKTKTVTDYQPYKAFKVKI